MLKKIFVGILIVLALALVFHSFLIGTVVKPQVEQQVSKILGTDVKINVLSVRLWPGSAAVYGLKIKNPSGFSDNYLLDLGSFSVALDVAGLVKEFTGGATGPKSLVIDQVKVKGLKLLVERIALAQGPKSNLEKLTENLDRQDKSEAAAEKTVPTEQTPESAKKPLDLKIELKEFNFVDGEITVRDSTIGSSGFEYVVDKINVDVKNIFFPAKPADELVETLDVSARLGKENPGTVNLQGRSNIMAGGNIDAKLSVKEVGIADFNAFVTEQPFKVVAGKFDLESTIKIFNNQLQSQHQLKLSSMELAGKSLGAELLDLPMQTLVSTLSRLPAIDVPFEVNGNLKNPQFKITQALKTAISNAIQKVLAGGLGDLTGAAKQLTGVANNVAGQAIGAVGGENAEKLTGDATKLVQGLTGETTESIEGGLKKLSGFLGKVKSDS